MYRKFLLIFLLFISPFFICCENIDRCKTSFESLKITTCESIIDATNTTHQCSYSGTCQTVYKTCESYQAAEGETFNQANCQTISTPKGKICKVNEGGNACEEKTCGDEVSEDICPYLDFKNDETETEKKRCAFNNGQCKAYYNLCSDAKTESICTSNIPQSPAESSCLWDGTNCNAVLKSCSQYPNLKDLGVLCKDLKASDGKTCVLNGNTCEEVEKADCETYIESDSNVCKQYKPIIKSPDNSLLKDSYKCEYSNDRSPKCYAKLKACSEYKARDECEAHATDVEDKTKTRCFYESSDATPSCKEKPIKCEEATKAECPSATPYIINDDDSITIDVHSECFLDGDTCKTRDKACIGLEESICISHLFKYDEVKKDIKKCIYKNNACKEVYKTCDIYDEENVAGKSKDDCEEIFTNDELYNCVYADNECKIEEKECSYGTNKNEEICSSIKLYNKTHYCLYRENKQCIEQYRICEDYKEKVDKDTCESIIPLDSTYKKCIFDKDSECVTKKKECSDYKGKMKDECETYYEPLDNVNFKCSFINNECIQTYRNTEYKYCSDYRGTDKEICESITPFKYSGTPTAYDYDVKCVLDEKKNCVKHDVQCKEISNAEECETIKLENDKKHCIFINNECNEEFDGCSNFEYNNKLSAVENEQLCTGIKKESCIYNAEGASNTEKCKSSTIKDCTKDYIIELIKIQKQCTSFTTGLDTIKEKCVYNNGNCLTEKKICSEISFQDGDSPNKEERESICEEATTNNKECVLKADLSGCKEIDNEQNGGDNTGDGDNNNNNNNNDNNNNNNNNNNSGDQGDGNNNSAQTKYLNKLLILIFCLLF